MKYQMGTYAVVKTLVWTQNKVVNMNDQDIVESQITATPLYFAPKERSLGALHTQKGTHTNKNKDAKPPNTTPCTMRSQAGVTVCIIENQISGSIPWFIHHLQQALGTGNHGLTIQ